MQSADQIVAEAAARGELPEINQENRAVFGLAFKRRSNSGQGWFAWWQADIKNGTSGITHPATTFHVATTALAPDGLPYPANWSLETVRGLTAGHRLQNLDFARRFDAERVKCGFDLLSAVVGCDKPTRVRCHCCGAEREHLVAANLIDSHFNPNRCFAQSDKGKSAATLARKAAIAINAKLLSRGIFRQCDPDDYVNNRTPIWFSCDCEEGGHVQTPRAVLRGKRPCQGSQRQKMANDKHTPAELSALGNATGIPALNGTATDAPWRVLTGQQERGNGTTEVYLFQTAVATVRNFGIAYDTAARAKRHHPDNAVALLSTRTYPDRDTAVLIEGAYKHRRACGDVPPGLEGCGNTTEYTLDDEPAFWAEIERLEEELAELGPVEFVQQWCHPWQYQKALEVGILAKYLAVA
jgi:hypothetical protein